MTVTDLLITYDVNTSTKAGRRRLRKVAKTCEDYGQRVQLSVFSCRVTRSQREALEACLVDLIDPETDSLHIYLLPGGRDECVRTYGRDPYQDFDDPLVI